MPPPSPEAFPYIALERLGRRRMFLTVPLPVAVQASSGNICRCVLATIRAGRQMLSSRLQLYSQSYSRSVSSSEGFWIR